LNGFVGPVRVSSAHDRCGESTDQKFVQNSGATGKHLASRAVQAQCLAAAVAALLGLIDGRDSALAAGVGALIVASGTGFFAWRLFVFGIAPVKTLLNSFYVAELLKWLLTVILLYLAIAVWRLSALPLIAGMLAAHAAFYFALYPSRQVL